MDPQSPSLVTTALSSVGAPATAFPAKMLQTKHPTRDVYGAQFPIMPNSLTYGAATCMIERPVGRKGKPMRVVIGLQDHAGGWHKAIFPRLKSR